jgi:hypothetical protein
MRIEHRLMHGSRSNPSTGPKVQRMSLSKKVKTALDETRLLLLGAQVLFGFYLHGVFQDAFERVSHTTRLVDCAGQFLMALVVGLLIAPSMQHRIVEDGEDTRRILRVTTLFAGLALLPFGVSLAFGLYIAFDRLSGPGLAIAAGGVFFLLAAFFWFGLAFALKSSIGIEPMREEEGATPLSTKIDQLLTEARVVAPGAQALLGFQFTVMFSRSFEQLPGSSQVLHVAALCCVALAVILLMTPAALHRISFGGEDTPSFFRIGSRFVVAATVPLALGIGMDLYVATAKASQSAGLGVVLAVAAIGILAGLWYGLPVVLRARGAGR